MSAHPDPFKLLAAAFDDPKFAPYTLPGTRGGALLVHGFPGTPHDMHALAEALNADGWEARALLLPGFGAEIESLPARRLEDWAGAVDAALRDLKQRHRHTLLVGHSMGGALALRAAADGQPDGLILLAPFWKLPGVLWTALPALGAVFRNIPVSRVVSMDVNDPNTRKELDAVFPGVDFDDPQVQAAVRDLAIPTKAINQVRRAGRAGYRAAPRVRARTLTLQGLRDPLVTPPLTRQLMTALPAPPRYLEVQGDHQIVDRKRPEWAAIECAVLELARAVADGA